jgi:hypothetical protein
VEIISGRMIHLGYGKYWRSDGILGLRPIEESRGPGRRTEVYVMGRDEPIIASRTEEAILEEMAMLPEELDRAVESQRVARDLLERLRQLSPVIRRMLRNEGGLDLERWIARLEAVAGGAEEPDDGQEDLFG